jgi:hypothetical protein
LKTEVIGNHKERESMDKPANPSKKQDSKEKKSWTVMVYMAADTTLINFAIESLKQMKASHNNLINIIALRKDIFLAKLRMSMERTILCVLLRNLI